jgi:hypothetical protein
MKDINLEILEFWDKNEDILTQYEEDHGINGRDYILGITDFDELKEILTDYIK